MTFRSGGIMSGIDTNSLISQLVSIERQPIRQMQARQSAFESQISKLGSVSSALSDLKTTLEEMNTRREVLSLNGTSGDEDYLRVSATGEASPGSYDLTITQLAKAEKDRSQAFGSSQDEVKEGTLTLTVKGADPVDVALEAGMTLQDAVEAINASGADVSASLVNDGTNTYLFLTALETGHTVGGTADDAIVLTESYTGGTGAELQLTQTQAAQNALFTLDGLAVEKDTNTVSDVVQGVTLELRRQTDVDTPTVDVTLVADVDGVKERIQGFVDSYNSIVSMLSSELNLEEDESRSGRLAGDSAVRRIQTTLQGIIASAVAGASGNFDSLASLGIKTGSSGELEVDDDDLTEALQSDLIGATSVFTTEDTGLAALMVSVVEDFVDPHEGTIKLRTDGLNRSIDLIDQQIDLAEMRVESFEANLVRQFTAMETMMSEYTFMGNYLTSTLG